MAEEEASFISAGAAELLRWRAAAPEAAADDEVLAADAFPQAAAPEAPDAADLPPGSVLGVAHAAAEECVKDVIINFDEAHWEPHSQKYGLDGLLRLREVMLPIPKPSETAHLKYLICPSAGPDGSEMDRDAAEAREARQRGTADRKGKGKGKDKGAKGGGGRHVPDMGSTQLVHTTQRGQWWRNVGADQLDVIVREQVSLLSVEIWKVPPGHYVQQGGHCEVFVSGRAMGILRMPVQPRGWATVDASAVGGPKYLETVKSARWRVVFKSGSNKGDIVVRERVSLESEEVAVLLCGTYVEQSGPQELLEDGIIRMPISFGENVGREPSSPSQPPKCRSGWVTCDATSQGGPKFFEPCPELEPQKMMPASTPQPGLPPAAQVQPPPSQPEPRQQEPDEPGPFAAVALQADGQRAAAGAAPAGGGSSWDKNRIWRVINLAQASGADRQLPMVSRAEPYAPGSGRVPQGDMIVRWLQNGDIVEQVGHSKKMRGYMVMPVRFMAGADGEPSGEGGEKQNDGWVTRRIVDKTRDHTDGAWFEEVRSGEDAERAAGGRRRQRRRDAEGQD